MGTRERKQREVQAREELFLSTARRLIREEGLLTLQMARLARACDYATGTLYQHFASKEDLLVALATQRMREHAEQFCRAASWQAGTRDRMFALSVVDHAFNRQHPGFARLLQYVFTEVVWESASPDRRQALQVELEAPAAAVTGIVSQAIADGELVSGRLTPQELMLGPWGLSAGIQSMQQTRGMLAGLGIEDPTRLLHHHVQAVLNGLGWQPLFDLDDGTALDGLVARIEREVIHAES
ncbi:MAG: TetR/AcrR family transcriptional regulator [Wenzhouxiangella sp.]|nr:MAG: TetR/AcrR family transcriptional regulator [Wenzhouxiangella sp.]